MTVRSAVANTSTATLVTAFSWERIGSRKQRAPLKGRGRNASRTSRDLVPTWQPLQRWPKERLEHARGRTGNLGLAEDNASLLMSVYWGLSGSATVLVRHRNTTLMELQFDVLMHIYCTLLSAWPMFWGVFPASNKQYFWYYYYIFFFYVF